MRRIVLPNPPSQSMSPELWRQEATVWMRQVKGLLEDASRINDRPMGQQFLSTDFTTNTVVTGTTTGTDLSNFVASLVAAMTDAGQVSATVARDQP